MSSRAIVIGNVNYTKLQTLSCCGADVAAMKRLLETTERFENIFVIENADADELKLKIREAVESTAATEELFFYYTGHGHQDESDFYFCATNFDEKRPNESGLSTAELHEILKIADADLVVKVIDACQSGTLLVKDANFFNRMGKGSFKNLIQIASCLETQSSMTGDPLSVFTNRFIGAALRKEDGLNRADNPGGCLVGVMQR